MIISSFCFSVCSGVIEKDNSNSLNTVQNEIIEKIKTWGPQIGLALSSHYLIESIGKVFVIIGKGIIFAYSSFYSTILNIFGPNIAGIFVISTYVVVVIVALGAAYTVYKVFTKDNTYIEIGSFKLKSGEANKKDKNEL